MVTVMFYKQLKTGNFFLKRSFCLEKGKYSETRVRFFITIKNQADNVEITKLIRTKIAISKDSRQY